MATTYKPEGHLIATPENRESIASLQGLERAMTLGRILEAPVTLCDGKMRLHVDLYGVRGIIEKEEVAFSPIGESVKDIAVITRVGKPVCFKVIGFEKQGGKTVAILSRRAAQMECYHNYISTLVCGDIIRGRITHLENFGAFVDIGCGIVSLLSIDCMSVSRIPHPRERVAVAEDIWAVVKAVDSIEKRVFISQRELLGTWEENASAFEAGQTVAGVVRSVESYGSFIELAPNLAGLAELKTDEMNLQIESLIGQHVAVYIKSIIPERMKIKLVLVDGYRGGIRKMPLRYYISGESCSHINYWRYSPECSQKIVDTVFSEESLA